MRVAIIGAGISGLSLYLWLRKLGLTSTHSIQIYERRADTYNPDTGQGTTEQLYNASIIGGSIGLGANGLRTLKHLDMGLYDEVMRTGNKISTWRMCAARGWELCSVSAGPEEVMIGREEFCLCFRRRVPSDVIANKKVVAVEWDGDGAKTLRFEDGSVEEADLVIGADGIWSIVRKAMFGKSTETVDKYQYAPKYEGSLGVGSFFDPKMLAGLPEGQMNIVFGRNGFFGYGLDKGYDAASRSYVDRGICWSTYTLKDLPSDWRTIDTEDANRQLKTRHLSWNIPIIQELVKEMNVDRVWPTFTTPRLPTWEKQGCVLIGDAAHAVQPSSGQGASQALEDTEVLARLLAHHLTTEPKAGHLLACRHFSDMRLPRLARVHKRAEQMSGMKADMSVFTEFTMYIIVWLMGNVMGKFGVGKDYFAWLYGYDAEVEVQQYLEKQRSYSQSR